MPVLIIFRCVHLRRAGARAGGLPRPGRPFLLALRASCVASSWAVASVYAPAFVAAPLCDVSQLCAEHIERSQPLEPLLSGGLWFPLWYAVAAAVMP